MRATFFVLASATTLSFAGGAIAMDRDMMKAYVFALTGAAEAEKSCIGMKLNESSLAILLDKANLTPADDAEVHDTIRKTKLDVQGALRKNGPAEWCTAIWKLLGPDGLTVIQKK